MAVSKYLDLLAGLFAKRPQPAKPNPKYDPYNRDDDDFALELSPEEEAAALDPYASGDREIDLDGDDGTPQREVKFLTSSAIATAQYDFPNEYLRVTFLESGRTYGYEGFPPEQWERFVAAPSKGRFFNGEIKNQYPYERLN